MKNRIFTFIFPFYLFLTNITIYAQIPDPNQGIRAKWMRGALGMLWLPERNFNGNIEGIRIDEFIDQIKDLRTIDFVQLPLTSPNIFSPIHVDVLPTLTSLVGIDFTSDKVMDGTNISNYLTQESPIKDRMLVTDTQRISWPVKGKQSCVMDGSWRLINGDELYDLSKDPGQTNNLAVQYPEKVTSMNSFYDSWWESVIAETKYSTIDLGEDDVEVITCHDARTVDYFPPWNQRKIREGKPMKPAPFFVNFVKPGNYTFKLRRWPMESGVALGAEINDEIPETETTDPRIKGESMKFKKAFLKIGNQEVSMNVDNSAQSADLQFTVEEGKTELLAWFEMEDGTLSNAFYVNVENSNK